MACESCFSCQLATWSGDSWKLKCVTSALVTVLNWWRIARTFTAIASWSIASRGIHAYPIANEGDMSLTTASEKSGRATVRIHYRDEHSGPWTTAVREVFRIPQPGDYIAPAPIHVFRVILTLHVLFEADYAAEVFAEVVDFYAIQNAALGEEVWQG